jgi:myo-inositol-1(or 4)-monophosphatase
VSSQPTLPTATDGSTAAEVIRHTAELARPLLLEGFAGTRATSAKGRGNVVTETDHAVEESVTAFLHDTFPDHDVMGEEHAPGVTSNGWMWVIDPVDGTKNFSRGIPHFAYNIALCWDSEPVLALTLNPVTHELFFAESGQGATLNGAPIRVGDAPDVANAVVAADLGYDDHRGAFQLDLARAVFPNVQSWRVPGSAALGFAYAAAGRWDLYLHSDLQPWDAAAGLLLVREAGGVVTDRDGQPATIFSPGTAAGGKAVHADFFARYGALPWK